jgi:hypothetical protein
MKVTNSKIIYLTEREVKEAIENWLAARYSYDHPYYSLFKNNHSMLDFDEHGNLAIVIDGEVEEYNSEKK